MSAGVEMRNLGRGKPVAEAVDPNARIPAAVRAASEAANRILEQTVAGDGNPPADPPAAPEPPAPTPPAQPPRQEAQPPAPPPAGDHESWEQRFRSEQGRSQAFQRQLREQNAALQDMQGEIARLRADIKKAPAAAPAAPAKYVTADEIEEYTPEFMDMVKRAAREENEALRAELEALKGGVEAIGGRVQESVEERFYRTLGERVPDWKDINKTDEWLEWCGGMNYAVGQTWQTLLDAAFNDGDAARVAAIFKSFKSEAAAVAPPEAQPSPPRDGRVPLEQFAAPGRPKPAPTPAPGEQDKGWVKSSDIAKFYSDVAAGKYRGRDQERIDSERTINEATRDGRVYRG